MRKVIGIGETVLDIIFKNDQPIGAVPGGSVFNGIISLGRAGVNATFISEVGNDRVGRGIVKFLQDNHVNADNVTYLPDGKSSVSLAFLDDNNDAEYLFYKNYPHDGQEFVYPEVNPDDIVVFGSFHAVNPVIRPQVMGFLEYARNHGAIIYYDVNFRPSHRHEVMKITPNLLENYEFADIVRGSKEDFEVLYKKTDAAGIYKADISFYCKNFIYTNGANAVHLFTGNGLQKDYPVNVTETVSTIGAGDNFNAGFIYGLLKYGITRHDIESGMNEEQWDKLMEYALLFSAECCKDVYNYVSEEWARGLGASPCLSQGGEEDVRH